MSGNVTVNGDGGGIHANSAVVNTSTISDNSAAGVGGGVRADSVVVANSTVSDNFVGPFGAGGGIVAGATTLAYAMVAGNRAPLVANLATDDLTAFASVVALPNGASTDCEVTNPTTSNGYNFSCGFATATDRQDAGDPFLGSLANNGGSTRTRLPQTGSPLIDQIPISSCQSDGASGITTDQRGVTRPQGTSCDIGSVDVAGTPPPVPGFYTALTPARILDTRDGTGDFNQPLGQGSQINLTVTGRGGVPASGVTGVVLNVTVTDTTAPSFLTLWPTGQPKPTASNLNWTAGVTIPNLVKARVGAGGKVSIYNLNGSAHVAADVVGWYSDGPSTGDGLTSVTPARILDTRSNIGGHPSPLGAGQSLDLTVTGQGGVPASGVTGVVLNVTATDTTAPSYLTVWPSGQARPTASNLNWAAGTTIPNLVIAKVGAGGKVSIYNLNGSANVVADVVGWYSDSSSTGSGFTSLSPVRILDTRSTIGGHPSALVGGQSLDLTVTGQGGVPANGVTTVALNVTVTDTTAGSYLTVWPTGQPRPTASNLNWAAGTTIPNLVIAKVGAGGKVSIYNFNGSANVVADVVGWY